MRKFVSRMLFIIGLLICIFPFAIRLISYLNQTTAITNYNTELINMNESELSQKKEESDEYNNRIADENPIISIGDEEFEEEKISSFDFLKTGNVIGTLIIPKINIELPIYDGLDDNSLQKGVAHLDSTSYPTGENSTHSVIAGHSGLTNSKILDDVDKLEIGDNFQIEYLGEKTNYKIVDIKIILPTETDSLKIQENRTLVTLVTCTPKGINTHRLLITAEKSEIEEEIINTNKFKNFIVQNIVLIIIVSLLIIIVVITIMIKIINKYKRKKDNTKKTQ